MISWVADHRKHHAFTDVPGDPHSPHVDHGHGWRGALRGLAHAHLGWLFLHTERGKKDRYARDLIDDPTISFIDRTFLLWVIIGLATPFVLGVAIGGSIMTGLTGILWGGLVRVFLLHHVTYSINSLCHFFGRKQLRHGRRVAQPAVARAAVVRRVVAQQPPRLPDLRAPRPQALGDRHLGRRDLGLEKLGWCGTSCGSRPSARSARRSARLDPRGERKRRSGS